MSRVQGCPIPPKVGKKRFTPCPSKSLGNVFLHSTQRGLGQDKNCVETQFPPSPLAHAVVMIIILLITVEVNRFTYEL